jgi:seryl-tRNA synthetase
MLDISFIREHRELVQHVADRKGTDLSVRELLQLDERRRRLMTDIEKLRYNRNRWSEQIGALIRNGEREQAEQLKSQVKRSNERLAALEADLAGVEAEYGRLMLLVPNPVSPDTPDGKSDADNVEVKRAGDIPEFHFEPRDHAELGEKLGILDLARGVKLAGTRGYVLKGIGFRLQQAVLRLAMDVLERRGFTPMDVPLLVRESALTHTGFFPTGRDQTFELADEDKYLIGTSEVSLVSYFSNEIIELNEPIRLAASTSCFRREVGSAGRDVRGLYRVHQFAKVEQVVLCRNDPAQSEQMLQEITRNAEEVLRLLELPYRIMSVCIGDMSQKTYKQYDIEAWMPSRRAYGETHSSSNLHDFQARRANIRYRDADGSLRYCHTLNCTAVASPRILIPLLEIHQREDGSVRIPEALRPYLNGMEEIRPE